MTYSSLNPLDTGRRPQEMPQSKRVLGVTVSTIAKFVVAAAFAFLVLGLDIKSPFEADQEPYYASVIRDVAENGHWLAPRDAYGEICRKPPLYLWLSALVVKAGGSSVTEAATRTVAVSAGALLAAETLLVAEACLGGVGGWLAYFFLLGSYGFASQAANAQTDMLMALLILSAVTLASCLESKETSAHAGVGIGLLLGLAILTKGPLALVLSGLAMALHQGLARKNPLELLRRAWVWRSLVVACCVGLSWYVAAWFSWRADLVTVHVLQENLGHFLPGSLGGTGEAWKPPYFPTVKLLGGALPMSLGLPALLLAMWSSWRWIAACDLIRLQLSVVVAVLVFFSLAHSKRPVYVLPAYPALAILLAWMFLTTGRRAEVKANLDGQDPDQSARTSPGHSSSIADFSYYLRNGACIMTVLGVAATLAAVATAKLAPGLLLKLTPHFAPTDAGYAGLFFNLAARSTPGITLYVAASAIGAAIVVIGLWRGRSALSSFGIAALALSGVCLWLGVLKPEHAKIYTLKSFLANAQRATGAAPVYVLDNEDYQASFYYKKTLPIWRRQEGVAKSGQGNVYFLGWTEDLLRAQPPAGRRLKIDFCNSVGRPHGRMCLAHLD
jgi:hypothetical protein